MLAITTIVFYNARYGGEIAVKEYLGKLPVWDESKIPVFVGVPEDTRWDGHLELSRTRDPLSKVYYTLVNRETIDANTMKITMSADLKSAYGDMIVRRVFEVKIRKDPGIFGRYKVAGGPKLKEVKWYK